LTSWPSRSGTSRRLGAVGAVAALAAGSVCLGTGCSGSVALGPEGHAIYEATVSARTARAWVYLDIQAPRSTTHILAEGETDLSNGACALGAQAGGVTTNELFMGNDLYFQVPEEARATSGGKLWDEVVLRASAGRGRAAAAGSALAGPELTDVDPTPLLGVLAAQRRHSVFVAKSIIGDHPANEYRLDVPTASLDARSASLAGPDAGPDAGPGKGRGSDGGVLGLIAGLPHPGKAVLAVYVWLDDQGQAVQLTASATLETEPAHPSALEAALANQLPATLSVRVDLGNFGERFVLKPPPLGEVSRVPVSQLEAGVL
jgi:hypothetical protein